MTSVFRADSSIAALAEDISLVAPDRQQAAAHLYEGSTLSRQRAAGQRHRGKRERQADQILETFISDYWQVLSSAAY